jgi:hypothetical protein
MHLKNILILALVGVLCSCHNYRKPLNTGLEGKTLPVFTLMRPDKTTFISTAELYFSTRCPYCRAQLQSIQEKIDQLKDIEFVVATDEPLQAVQIFCKENDLTHIKNLRLGIDTGRFLSNYFKTSAVPYTAFYGKNRMLKHAFLGNLYANQIKTVAQE